MAFFSSELVRKGSVARAPASSGTKALMGVPFEFLNAMLRGRRRLVYEGARLGEVADVRSVEELARRLCPREAVGGRLGLERRLRADCLRELTFFLHYLPAKVEGFYLAMVRRFQVDAIQTLLRLFAGGREEPAPERFLPDLPPALALDVGALMASGGLEEFCGGLPGGFAQAALASLDLCERAGSAAFAEMAVERAFWEAVTESLAGLPAQWREACARPVLSELRSTRLLTVLRAAGVYGVEWGDVERILPACDPRLHADEGAQLSGSALRALHADPSVQKATALVPGLRRKRRAEAAGEVGASLVELEDLCWRATFRLANRLYYAVLEGPAILVSYFYVRRNELNELTALMEALHYGRRPPWRKGDGSGT